MSPRIDSWSCLSPHLVSRTKNDVSSYRHSDANQRHIRGINAPQTPLSPTSQGKPGPSPLPSRTLPLRHTRRRRPNWWPPVCAGPAYSIPPICSRRGGDPTHHGGVPSCGCARPSRVFSPGAASLSRGLRGRPRVDRLLDRLDAHGEDGGRAFAWYMLLLVCILAALEVAILRWRAPSDGRSVDPFKDQFGLARLTIRPCKGLAKQQLTLQEPGQGSRPSVDGVACWSVGRQPPALATAPLHLRESPTKTRFRHRPVSASPLAVCASRARSCV